jgi:hypothetical protein
VVVVAVTVGPPAVIGATGSVASCSASVRLPTLDGAGSMMIAYVPETGSAKVSMKPVPPWETLTVVRLTSSGL